MAASFVVYVDESGDEGFTFRPSPNKGSSDWFVLSAVVVRQENDRLIAESGESIRSAIGLKTKDTMHFADVHHNKRVRVYEELAKLPIRYISVLVNKRQIEKPGIFQEEPFRLYRYATRLLLERVSWFCRDMARSNLMMSCEAKLIFEHRKRMSYDDLKGYILALQRSSELDEFFKMLVHDIRIHWPAINLERLKAAQKHDYTGLQFSDFVASGLRGALEESKFGNTEHRYAKMLKSNTYSHNGNSTSYGLKFFPTEPPRESSTAHWINKHYR